VWLGEVNREHSVDVLIHAHCKLDNRHSPEVTALADYNHANVCGLGLHVFRHKKRLILMRYTLKREDR
jgi:hypothetical protein